MARLNASNNAGSVLTQAISELDTTISVEDVSSFPELPYLLTLDKREIVLVNEVNGNTLTVERGQEETAIESFPVGAEIENNLTAGMYNELVLEGEFAAHKAEKATLTKEGHVMIGDDLNILDGVVSVNRSFFGSTTNSFNLGNNASAGSNGMAIGHDATSGNIGTAIGRNAKAEGFATAIGGSANAAGQHSLALLGSATGTHSIAIGKSSQSINANEGVLGLGTNNTNGANKWIIPGNFTVSGTKNFEIPHPNPNKKASHRIRHGAVESPTAGDTLYRYRVQSTKENDLQTIDLPDYFVHLNKDVQIFVTPQRHFGNGYGVLNRETEQLEIHCQSIGEYNILVIGTRNDDHRSVQDWDIKGVEREIGESWTGETYVFSVDEIIEVEEIKEVEA